MPDPSPTDDHQRPLRIGLLSYRSNPHSGGQGVYIKNLARGLSRLGHQVTVIAGPPDPQLDDSIAIQHIACLDLFDPQDPFRVPSLKELTHPLNLIEWLAVSTGGFPEPFLFGIRAYHWLRDKTSRFDILHDNQSLSYGIWAAGRLLPTVATIHHPITVDRDVAIRSAVKFGEKLRQFRWHSFVGMQKCVARRLSRIITVSAAARDDIVKEFGVPQQRFRIVPNGINTDLFRPLEQIQREAGRLIVTNSADIPLKGLAYLIKAVAALNGQHRLQLTVIGAPKRNGTIVQLIRQLGIGSQVRFTGRISDTALVEEYARAAVAVVPSVYEGFGLPAGEAMACGLPVISTTGGALPEVVGQAGLLVPPKDHLALAKALKTLLDHPGKAAAMGRAGFKRVHERFTWRQAAQQTVAVYREAINDYGRI